MKEVRFSLLFVCLIYVYNYLPLFSQTQIKEFEDGKIFVRTEILQDEIPSVDAKVNLNEVYFLDENTISQFGIFAISKPFYRTKDKSLRTIYLIEFSEVNRIDELISKLNRNPLLEYAEHVPVLHDFFIPNDLGPNNDTTDGQWYLYNINAINAWDQVQGDSNIVVAVVDAGTYIIHDDLKDGIWKNHAEIPNNGIDDDNNGYVDDINGFHPHLNSSNVLPNSLDNNHGTHMSGLVGATNNNGIGIASIAGGVKIMPVTGNGSLERLLGVVYAVDAGARVINMSWGVVSPYASTSVYSVIKYAHDRDVIMVCGAGNFYGLTVSYPAAFDEVITVTARDINNERADFASHGTWVNLSAPGVNILSTSIGSDSSSIYRLESGTSCSSALVSGVVGLMLSANPYLSKANVEHCLYSTAIPVNDIYNGLMGHGRVNALDAVLCAKSFLNLPPDVVVTASDSHICNMNLIKFHSWSNAGPEVNRTWSFPGGTPSSSNLKNPIVAYNSPGTYDVQLIASNNFGADTILLQNFVNVGVPNEQIIFKEDFEKTPKVSIHNPDMNHTWAVQFVNGDSSGVRSAVIKNKSSSNVLNTVDAIVSPNLDLSIYSDIYLDFNHAYAYDGQKSDSLFIYVSTDNGLNWDLVQTYAEDGTGNFATVNMSEEFIIYGPSSWCGTQNTPSCNSVDLSAYNGAPVFKFKIENKCNNGNTLYIDNIVLRGKCQADDFNIPTAVYTSDKTVICQDEKVKFYNLSPINTTESVNWLFEGGSPLSSTLYNPEVTYYSMGVFNVSMTANGMAGSSTINSLNIEVLPKTPIYIIKSDNVLKAYPDSLSYKWYRNGFILNGYNTNEYPLVANGEYYAVTTNSLGCVSKSNSIFITTGNESFSNLSIDVNLYPNPSSDYVTLNWDYPLMDKMTISNILGAEVYAENVKNKSNASIAISHLAPGIYFVKLNSQSGLYVVKELIIAR